MYIVKHIPSGKYIRKTSSHPLYYLKHEYLRERVLTDNINKARIYSKKAHILNSIGTRPIIKRETKEITVYGGKKDLRDVITLGEIRIDPELFEVIELEDIKIKEK